MIDLYHFSDILISRRLHYDWSWFTTPVYRKPIFTGLMLKWKSFVSFEYNKSEISSMVYRAIRISSTYQTPHKEYLFIRQQSVSSGYPLPFVLDIIRITLDTHLYNYISTTSPIETDSSPPKNIKRGPDKKMYLKDMYVLQIFHMWVDKYHPMEKN